MALQSIQHLNDPEFQTFLDSFDTVVTDCDCVLWLEDESLPGSPETINYLKSIGKNIIYMTNNSTKTRDQLLKKCIHLGFNAEKDEIIGTAYIAALYLHKLGFKQKVYVFGSQAIVDELKEFGIESFGCGPDTMETDVRTFGKNMKLAEDVGAVIVGYDEHISYPKLAKALSYLLNKECLFIATNNDPTKKTQFPELKVPGAGCMVQSLKASVQRDPIYMGKPHQVMQQTILSNKKVNPQRTIMIGDKPSTDILIGKRCGFKTLMVLSGTTSLEQVELWKQSDDPVLLELVPEYYTPLLGDIVKRIKRTK